MDSQVENGDQEDSVSKTATTNASPMRTARTSACPPCLSSLASISTRHCALGIPHLHLAVHHPGDALHDFAQATMGKKIEYTTIVVRTG